MAGSMKHPLLYLGLMGFDAESEAAVRRWLAKNAEPDHGDELAELHPIWQVVDFREADALLIRGAGVASCLGSYLQFLPALQLDTPYVRISSPLGVELSSLSLPFALSDSEHLRALGVNVQQHLTLDLHQDSSLLQAMLQLEMNVRPLRSLFALACELTERQQELDINHTYHLERNGALDAIVDMPKWRVLLSPNVRPIDIGTDAWQRRPKSANFAPPGFVECSFHELGWVYAMHRPRVLLPKRYRTELIYVRRNPRVRSSLLYPRHATLMDRLWSGPQTYEQLQRDHPELRAWLARDLDALYLTRSITTQRPGNSGGEMSSLPVSFAHTSAGTQKRVLSPSSEPADQRTHTVAADLPPLF